MRPLPIFLLFLMFLNSGCISTEHCTYLYDTLRFRRDLFNDRLEVRRTAMEAERRELERLRRAELREIREQMVDVVPELKTSLETKLNQKISNMRLVPDYAAMAKASETLAKLEEENERIYQEELAIWLQEQSEIQRQEIHLASWRTFCPHHGYDCCECPKEPTCGEPPPKARVREAPMKPELPRLPVQYKLEFALEHDVESSAFVEAEVGRAPVKELCLPDEKPCKCDGKNSCDDCRKATMKKADLRRPPVSVGRLQPPPPVYREDDFIPPTPPMDYDDPPTPPQAHDDDESMQKQPFREPKAIGRSQFKLHDRLTGWTNNIVIRDDLADSLQETPAEIWLRSLSP